MIVAQFMDDIKVEADETPNDIEGLALRRYDIVLRQFASETNMFWVRAQFFLLANTALVAFTLNQMPMGDRIFPSWNRLLTLGLVSGVGGTLTWLWRSALETGEQWIDHWKEVIVGDLEAPAFGNIALLREWKLKRPDVRRSLSTKKLAHWLARIFAVVWSLNLAYLVFMGWAKFVGWFPAVSN